MGSVLKGFEKSLLLKEFTISYKSGHQNKQDVFADSYSQNDLEKIVDSLMKPLNQRILEKSKLLM